MKKIQTKIIGLSLSVMMLLCMGNAVYASRAQARASGFSDEATVKAWQENTIAKFSGSTVKKTTEKAMGLSVIEISGIERMSYWPIKILSNGKDVDLGNGINVRATDVETVETDMKFTNTSESTAIGTILGVEMENYNWSNSTGRTTIWANWR